MEDEGNDAEKNTSAVNVVDDWNPFPSTAMSSNKFISGGLLKSFTTAKSPLKPYSKHIEERSTKTVGDGKEVELSATQSELQQLREAHVVTPSTCYVPSHLINSVGSNPYGFKGAHLEALELEGGSYTISLSATRLQTHPMRFGREAAEVRLYHVSCSRKHAEISCVKSQDTVNEFNFFLKDLNSANGTLLNDGRLPPSRLSKLDDGDEIKFGFCETLYVFRNGSPEVTCKELPESQGKNYSLNTEPPLEAPSKKRPFNSEAADGNDVDKSDKIKHRINDVPTKGEKPFEGNSDVKVDKIRCKHILLKHKESRRPFDSYRKKQVTRKKEDAYCKLRDIEAVVREDLTQFDKYAVNFSECSSARNGGDLGMFGRKQMQAAFEEAAFALKIGEMSDLTETDSGYHLIYRVC